MKNLPNNRLAAEGLTLAKSMNLNEGNDPKWGSQAPSFDADSDYTERWDGYL